MTIKTKLQLTTIVTTLVALGLGLVIFSAISTVSTRAEEVKRGAKIVEQLDQLKNLSTSYFSSSAEKEILKWYSKYDTINNLLSDNFPDQQRQILLENIRQNFSILGQIFKDVSQGNGISHSNADVLYRLQLIQSQSFQLNEFNQSAFATEERNVKLLFVLALAIMITIFATISYLARTSIIEPLSKLSYEARVISKGKLRFKMTDFKNDEMGQLGKAIDYMVLQLKQLNAGLEEKILRRTSQLSLKITELQNAKKAMDNLIQSLQNLNAKDKVILSSIGEGMIIADQKGNINFVNKTFEDLFNLNIDTLKNKKIFDYIIREDKNEPIEGTFFYKGIITGKSFHNLTGYIFKCANKEVSLGITVSPLMIKGKNAGSIILLNDRTKEKDLEMMKKNFLAFIADQLRTPLGSMRWNIEMLMENQDSNLNTETKESLQQMHENNQRILELVNQLLDVTNTKKGELENKIKSLSLDA